MFPLLSLSCTGGIICVFWPMYRQRFSLRTLDTGWDFLTVPAPFVHLCWLWVTNLRVVKSMKMLSGFKADPKNHCDLFLFLVWGNTKQNDKRKIVTSWFITMCSMHYFFTRSHVNTNYISEIYCTNATIQLLWWNTCSLYFPVLLVEKSLWLLLEEVIEKFS